MFSGLLQQADHLDKKMQLCFRSTLRLAQRRPTCGFYSAPSTPQKQEGTAVQSQYPSMNDVIFQASTRTANSSTCHQFTFNYKGADEPLGRTQVRDESEQVPVAGSRRTSALAGGGRHFALGGDVSEARRVHFRSPMRTGHTVHGVGAVWWE